MFSGHGPGVLRRVACMTPDPPGRVGRPEALLVAAITVAGGALRLYGLGTRSLWYDEAVIYHVVQGGVGDILAQNAAQNSAPPLYVLLLGLLTGPDASEAVLRGLSMLAGTAAIPLCFLLGRQFLPARSAWLVPLLAAVSPTQIIYSQQLREYSLTVALAALLLWAYVRFVRNPDERNARWIAAAAVLGLATQYGLGLMLTALNVVCLGAFALSGQPLASYRRWFASQLLPALVALVLYFAVLREQAATVEEAGLGYLAPYLWDGTWSNFLTLLWSPPEHDMVAFGLPGIVMLALWSLGLLAFLFGSGTALATALCLAPMGITLAAAMAGAYPYGPIRQDIFLTPMIFVIAVLGADRLLALLPARWPAVLPRGLAALLAPLIALPGLGVSLAFVNEPVGYQPMRMIGETLALQLRPGDTIYVYHNAIPAFSYYWRNRDEPWIKGAFHRSFMDENKALDQMAAVQDELRGLMRRGQPYWVVISHVSTADEDWLMEFLERYASVEIVERAYGSSLLHVTPIAGR